MAVKTYSRQAVTEFITASNYASRRTGERNEYSSVHATYVHG